jgi:hypothetical protein
MINSVTCSVFVVLFLLLNYRLNSGFIKHTVFERHHSTLNNFHQHSLLAEDSIFLSRLSKFSVNIPVKLQNLYDFHILVLSLLASTRWRRYWEEVHNDGSDGYNGMNAALERKNYLDQVDRRAWLSCFVFFFHETTGMDGWMDKYEVTEKDAALPCNMNQVVR